MKTNRSASIILTLILALSTSCISTAQDLSSTDRINSTMKRYQIDQSSHPEAVCNDGSTPVFYHRPGIEDGVNKWVVWFKGGGSCWNRETCKDRSKSLMSSRPWMTPDLAELSPKGNVGSQDGKAGGILDPDPAVNPDFHTWNHAYLVYCSSDAWGGNNVETKRQRTIHFRGHQIVDAMFDALEDTNIIGETTLTQASHILLTGSSAGSNGLLTNLDRLTERFSFADVRGVSDGSTVPSVTEEIQELEENMYKLRFKYWNPQADASCIEKTDEENAWRCLTSPYLVSNNYLSTPAFFHQDQSDKAHPTGGLPEMAEAIRDLLAPLPGVFSPNDGLHIILNDPRFNQQEINGYTMADVLGNWYFDRDGPKNIIEGLNEEAGEED